jgi:hypothetical protein
MTPPAWDILAEELWYLSPHESRTLWHAVAHSRWWRPVALRQALSLVGHIRVDLDHLCGRVVTPQSLLALVEALVHEGQLRRVQAGHIEATLLQQVDHTGRWRGGGDPPPCRQSTCAPDITVLAETGKPL